MNIIPNLYGEKPASKWMKYYINLIHPFTTKYTLAEQRKINKINEFHLSIRKVNHRYILSDGLWKSKKDINDILSYLNQYSFDDNKVTIYIYYDTPYGCCHFIDDMINIKNRFKNINFADFSIKDDSNIYYSVSNAIN